MTKFKKCDCQFIDYKQLMTDNHIMDDIILKQFGASLKIIRKKKGLSQEDLASMINFDRTYISFLETGKRNPSLICINAIRLALNITFSELLDENNE